MAQITPIAQTIIGDEKAMGLYEIHEQSPMSQGFHRYQIIHVIRDDKVSEFRRDMGVVKGRWEKTRELRILGLLEHTVDELMALADDLRNENTVQDLVDIYELTGVLDK